MTCNNFFFGQTDYERDYMYFDIPRNNKDRDVFNQFVQSLADLCCIFNIQIINGRLYDDTDDNYTCTVNNGASVVDYKIASRNLFPHISYFNVENRDESVHFPLYCQFKFRSDNVVTQADAALAEPVNSTVRIRWNTDLKEINFCIYM